MNVFTFSGRLGRDATLRNTRGGDPVLSFPVANEVGFGERKTTQWIECSLWGKRGERLHDYLTKGAQVVVSGELTLREFERTGGTPGASLSVRVTEVTLVGGRRDGEGRGDDRGDGGGYGGGPHRGAPGRNLDDEIPFGPEIR